MLEKQNLRLPPLRANNTQLFTLYHNKILIDAKTLREVFCISETKAHKVINLIREYMVDNDMGHICPPTQKQVPNTLLFELYGWDIKQINISVRTLQKLNLA